MSNNTLIAKNSLLLALRMVFVLAVSLYTTRVILDVLGASDYGIYNVVCGFVSMFAFLNTAMSNATQRFYNYELGKQSSQGIVSVFNASIRIQYIILFIIVLLVEVIGIWYINNKLVIPNERIFAARTIFQFSVMSMAFVILQVPYSAAIMAYERMNFFALVSFLDVILKLAIVLSIRYVPFDKLIFYGFMLVLVSLFNFILYFIYVRMNFKHLVYTSRPPFKLFYSMLAFSGWNTFGSFANIARAQGLNILLNFFWGPIVNAARAIAFQVEAALTSFVANINTAVRPQLIQSYSAGNSQRSIALMFSISKVTFVILYIMILPIIYEVDYILHIWLGADVPAHTASFIRVVLLITLVTNLNTPVSMVVHAVGEMKLYQVLTSIISLLTLPIAYVFLKLGFVPEVVFLISLLFESIKQLISILVLKNLVDFSIKDYIKDVIFRLIALVFITFYIPVIPILCFTQGFIRLVLVCGISGIIVLVLTYFITLNINEKLLVRNLISKFYKNVIIRQSSEENSSI